MAPSARRQRSVPVQDVTLDRNAYSFSTEVRVRLAETDAVGIVFFGSFSTYMDVGRMDYLNHLGLDRYGGHVRGLIPGAVVDTHLSFRSPARYNDILTLHVRIAHLGDTSYTFHFLITDKKQPRVVATGHLTLVWLDESFRPLALPDAFRQSVEAFEGARLQSGRSP
jgi:acyl-CoA thioester hydrolase